MAKQNKEIKQKALSPWDKDILTEAKAFMEGKYTRLRVLAKEIFKESFWPKTPNVIIEKTMARKNLLLIL